MVSSDNNLDQVWGQSKLFLNLVSRSGQSPFSLNQKSPKSFIYWSGWHFLQWSVIKTILGLKLATILISIYLPKSNTVYGAEHSDVCCNTLPRTIFFDYYLFTGEGVGTSKITTSKGQNVESIFRMIRTSKVKKITMLKVWSERQKSLRQKECRKSEKVRLSTFWSFLTPQVISKRQRSNL